MKLISSSSNDIYKELKQLARSSKRRQQTGQTLVEGIHLSQSYLNQLGAPMKCVYSESATANREVSAIMASCEKAGVEMILLSDRLFKAISSVENGIGVMLVVTMPVAAGPSRLLGDALLLDSVQDPGNMGTILRTAAAAGVQEVYASRNCASAWSPKTLRAGMGAHFALSIYENNDLKELIESSNVQVLATSLEATVSIYQKDLTRPTAWLFGSEGQGVSEELLKLNVEKVIIPQNQAVESLNVAASVAVCLFEQQRQRRGL